MESKGNTPLMALGKLILLIVFIIIETFTAYFLFKLIITRAIS